ncbi:MAG: restriction endonuclease, SacI family [Verrucomicrobia bacterium]|nr:restriction endonuclease, SacI family [Verrucomicrobiota bacterium]
MSNNQDCSKLLEAAVQRATARLQDSFITDSALREKLAYVINCPSNRAGARFLMAGTLAKLDDPKLDIRKPFIEVYTGAAKKNAYSGRGYDEQHVFDLIRKHRLPCSATTAFLTPGFRTKNVVLTKDQKLRGRPAEMYEHILEILDAIHKGNLSAHDVLDESIRLLILERDQRQKRLKTLLEGLRKDAGELPLSSEDIVNLIEQHLQCKHASRLPVLIVAAAYRAAAERLGEKVLRLNAHNAADKQTGALGDVEITLLGDDKIVTTYEMKDKIVAQGDIDIAIEKIAQGATIQNFIFITTEAVDPEVRAYATAQYAELGGIEIAILDCIAFLRHFLHLFHRIRMDFLNQYQELVLNEPESGVNQALKEAFLALRKTAEAME